MASLGILPDRTGDRKSLQGIPRGDPMRSNGSHEGPGGAPGVAPGMFSRLIDLHLHIGENVVKSSENGHEILVPGAPDSILGPLSSPLSSRCSWQARKVLEGVLSAAQDSSRTSWLPPRRPLLCPRGPFESPRDIPGKPRAWKQYKNHFFFNDFDIDRPVHKIVPRGSSYLPGRPWEPYQIAPATTNHSKGSPEVIP